VKRSLLAAVIVALAVAAAASASSSPGFLGCKAFVAPSSTPQVRPSQIVVACGDGGFFLSKLKWSRWNATGAVATGKANENDCNPNCAAGHFHAYAVQVKLSKVATCGGNHVFSKLSWSFTAKRPKGVPKTGSQIFRCS
jgi:hypothetical protein